MRRVRRPFQQRAGGCARAMNRTPEATQPFLFTVDVEDWFQAENLRSTHPVRSWDSYEQRVESNTESLLDLLEVHGVRATFFVLGWVAEKCGRIVAEIDRRGHEVASHGHTHQLCFALTHRELREDFHRSKCVLENLTGRAVYGYRAPCFSITDRAVEIMGELGYRYDSSYNSFSVDRRHGRASGLEGSGGKGRAFPNGIVELPVSNLAIAGRTIPWGGGGYFRFWPPRLFSWGVRQILKKDGVYVFYCHPWEIDPFQPRVNRMGILDRYRHYKNVGRTMDRLDAFLTEFGSHDFVQCRSYVAALKRTGLVPEAEHVPGRPAGEGPWRHISLNETAGSETCA